MDGGMSYIRRAVNGKSAYVDTSLAMEEEAIKDITEAVKWGKETNRTDFGIALAVIRALNKHNLLDKSKLEVFDND